MGVYAHPTFRTVASWAVTAALLLTALLQLCAPFLHGPSLDPVLP